MASGGKEKRPTAIGAEPAPEPMAWLRRIRPAWRAAHGHLAPVGQRLKGDPLAKAGAVVLVLFALVALFGHLVAPYDPVERLRDDNGRLAYLLPPSSGHLLGTTNFGRDIFSQLLVGARFAFIVGGIAALCETLIGAFLGLVAGYFKGVVDHVVMRAVDVAFALPLEPVAIVMLVFIGQSIWTTILVIVLLTWRFPARIIRTQVLSVSERAFVKGARVIGASNWRILFRHIAPSILPIAIVYLPIGFGSAIVAEASISFLGFGDPTVTTWGGMLRDAFSSGATETAWWWGLAPGVCITAVVASVFFVTRAFENVLNPRLEAVKR